MNIPFLTRSYCALLDQSSKAVLTVGMNIPAMIFLYESTPNTSWVSGVQYPNYTKSFRLFFIPSMTPEERPTWAWDSVSREFVKTKKEYLDNKLYAKSALMESKRSVFEFVVADLNSARLQLMTGMDFQQTVYLKKKMQAQAFKESGYNEDLIFEYPYVVQYADIANIPLAQAADDILLKAKLDDDVLMKTELLRLKHLTKLKNASTLDEIGLVREEFVRDSYLMH